MEQPKKVGRYEILERVGRGGMGVLYRGHDAVLDREVAIKVMSADLGADETMRPRFYREARAAAKLQHRNIVTIFEFGEEDATPYIVMEFLHGQDLAKRMKAQPPLTLEAKLDIVAELCTGLHFAHEQGVIHRDVKPANIRLLPDGSVKLLDFGIAKMAQSQLTQSGSVFGSASYMSPEQVQGAAIDGRSDIFSAGVVLYELITGKKPFAGDSPTAVIAKLLTEEPEPVEKLVPGLPKPLIAAVKKALEKDPAKRYAKAGDFGADLRISRSALQAHSVAAPPPPVDFAETTLFTKADTPAPGADLSLKRGATALVTPTVEVDATPKGKIGLGIAAAVVVVAAGVGGYLWMSPKTTSTPGTDAKPPAVETPAQPPETVTPAAKDKPGAAATTLRVSSEPAGAAIVLDGRDTGKVTPADLALGGRAPSQVRLIKKGFAPFDARLSAADLKAGRVEYRLSTAEEPPFDVVVTGDYAFQVMEGDRVLSPPQKSHELKLSGRHALRLRAADVFLDRTLNVEPNAARRVELTVPQLGALTLRTPLETCRVLVGGRELGFPPINNVPIAAGSYTIELACPDGPGRRVPVTIEPGQTRMELVR